jgi:hypothetical protein
MLRIVKVPIYHEGTFQAIVSTATQAGSCVCYAGQSWEPVEESGEFGVYQLTPGGLSLIRDRVENYELFLYSRLLEGQCGTDGVLRPRTRLRRGSNRALRGGRSSSGAGTGAKS